MSEPGRHAAPRGDRSRGLAQTINAVRHVWFRVPFIELAAVWLLRRRVGIYEYDLEPLLDFWRGGRMADPVRIHHLLLVGPWLLAFVVTLGFQFVTARVGHAVGVSGLDEGYPWAYFYALIPLAVIYHLACALLAGRATHHGVWRWTSSFPVEVTLVLISIPISAHG